MYSVDIYSHVRRAFLKDWTCHADIAHRYKLRRFAPKFSTEILHVIAVLQFHKHFNSESIKPAAAQTEAANVRQGSTA